MIRRLITLLLFVAVALVPLAGPRSPVPSAPPSAAASTVPDGGRLPLAFEPNAGQSGAAVRYLAHSPAGLLFFTAGEVVLTLKKAALQSAAPARPVAAPPRAGVEAVLRLRFLGANASVVLEGREALPGRVSYLRGRDPAQWHTGIPTFARLIYRQLYPGIDLEYTGRGAELKGTYVIAPGADPARIRWRYAGSARVRLDDEGNVRIDAGAAEGQAPYRLIEQAPVAWQAIGGQRVAVDVRYVLAADGSLGLAIGRYDGTRALVVDPLLLVYSTYLGGSYSDYGYAIAVDAAGSAYAAGFATSPNFPLQDPFQPVCASCPEIGDGFVTKFDPSGTTLVYSTYLGGSDDDIIYGIRVDQDGNVYLAGVTGSLDFPLRNPWQGTLGGFADVFVAKLNPDGTDLVYSTYLGGSGDEVAQALAVDAAGRASIAGYTNSTDLPLVNPFQAAFGGGDWDAFVAQFNATGSAPVYATYLGGSDWDDAFAVAVDAGGSVYVTGRTLSPNYPLQNPFQSTLAGGYDVFVTRFSPAGTVLIYSTYLGGSDSEIGFGLAVDETSHAYVAGSTGSTNFPVANAFQNVNRGRVDAFVTKLDPSGTALVYSTYLGGSGDDEAYALAVDAAENVYLGGSTQSLNFPLLDPFQDNYAGYYDAFLTQFTASGTALRYSTYLGGSSNDWILALAVDSGGGAYATGLTNSVSFPLQSPVQDTFGGHVDAFVAKLELAGTPTPTITGTLTPTATRTATPASTATASPTATPTATPTPSASPMASATPTATPTRTPTPTGTPLPTATATASRTGTPSPTTLMPTATPSPTRTATATPTPSPSQASTDTRTPSPTDTLTATRMPTPSALPTASPTLTVGASATPPTLPTDTPQPTTTATASWYNVYLPGAFYNAVQP